MHFCEYHSPAGKLLLCSDGKALRGAWFDRETPQKQEEDAILKAAKTWLDGYFRGETAAPDFPLSPEGTAFQRKVWGLLLQIPYGKTCTYGQLAESFPGKMSPQAIGQAVGRNPMAIFIPCHRCLGAKGQLTGYAWGTERKQRLLQHEQKGRA